MRADLVDATTEDDDQYCEVCTLVKGWPNGKAGLEGTFLGPSIVTGRMAGRTILSELGAAKTLTPIVEEKPRVRAPGDSIETPVKSDCMTCHDVAGLIEDSRSGYSHFEKVHRVVLERDDDCGRCHYELVPIDLDRHQTDPLVQAESCESCHVATEH